MLVGVIDEHALALPPGVALAADLHVGARGVREPAVDLDLLVGGPGYSLQGGAVGGGWMGVVLHNETAYNIM